MPEALLQFFAWFLFLFGLGNLGMVAVLKMVEAGLPIHRDLAALIFQALTFHLGGMLLVGWLLKAHQLTWTEAFGLNVGKPLQIIKTALMVAVGGLVMTLLIGAMVSQLLTHLGHEPNPQAAVDAFQNATHLGHRVVLAVFAVLVAPLVEEVLFRGILHTALLQVLPRWAAILLGALFFGVVHANLVSFLPLTLLAVFLTRLYERTSNLSACVLAHALFNSFNLTLMLLNPEWPPPAEP